MRLALRETAFPTLALLTSVSTLLCCALPAFLVVIGAGAVMAGLVSSVPGLVWFSANKVWVFAGAGVMLTTASAFKWMGRNAPCPADPELGRACNRLRRWGLWLLIAAWVMFLIGGFFAFFAADLLL